MGKSIYSATARIALMLIVVTASASCSLKEVRDGCPCHLIIGLEKAVGNGNTGIYIFQDGEEAITDNVEPSEFPDGYLAEVRRKPASVAVLQGLREGIVDGGKLIIRDGDDADQLFLHNEMLQCNSETVKTTAGLHKNWATLELCLAVMEDDSGWDTLDTNPGTGEEEITDIFVSGGICGTDLRTGKPIKGDFRCSAKLSDSGFGVYSVNLPRQGDAGDEIIISVRRGGKEMFSCDIAEAISETGFDWSKPDLDDIRLRLDYVSATFSIEIAGWDRGAENDKII